MAISVFDLYSIGVGPSSSHTVGPMRAAVTFLQSLGAEEWRRLARLKVQLFGSLALTGHGHGTDRAVLLGLQGILPENCDPDEVEERLRSIRDDGQIRLLGKHVLDFDIERDLIFHMDRTLPYHSNGMRFTIEDADGKVICRKVYYSIGGGFVVDHEHAKEDDLGVNEGDAVPHPFKTAEELLHHCEAQGLSISEVMWVNERSWRSDEEIRQGLLEIWGVMRACVERGCHSKEQVLPGSLRVRRRAPDLLKHLEAAQVAGSSDPAEVMDWISLWALAVNEENAAGGRVVTAPTNGAAGIIPAVLHYYHTFVPEASEEGIVTFMLTAAAIGILYKEGASISAAEVGCQGEVGVACSMAAAGLAEVCGGLPVQVAQAAEIGMEHNLGLTCDPVAGLVQIPCIERNTMGSVKAVNAARLALREEGLSKVSLDQVIRTMRQTGIDMQSIYKETSQGGLAVNVPEC